MRLLITLVLACLVLCGLPGLYGCAAAGENRVAAGDTAPHGECKVCKCNADLACVNVKVTDQTPRSIYNGQTYYFCSDECKAAFDQQPTRYVAR